MTVRARAALILVAGIVAAACSSSADPAPGAGSPASGVSSLALPLPAFDAEAFRAAETKLRSDGRERAGLAKLGPSALEFASFMDRTASFSLTQIQPKLTAFSPSSGRLASRAVGLPPPGAPIVGTYIITSLVFNQLISELAEKSPPGSKTQDLDPTTDTVTVGGHKGTITTTVTASITKSASKISLLIQIKVSGEVRDGTTGAILYKIANEATGVATGDACPDASGTAHAQLTFRGKEDYFDASGAKTGTGVDEGFGGELKIKADDNAKLAGVDITTSGGVAAAGSLAKELGIRLIEITAQGAAPAFENAWRSGICVEILVEPDGGDVDKDSVTNVTAKVRHKIDGTELDKPVEAEFTGSKSLEPTEKQKSPAKFRFTAGSESGDKGDISFETISNRGIAHVGTTFTVAGGAWTINSVGTYTLGVATTPGSASRNIDVVIKDLKLKAGKEGTITGSGTLTLRGVVTSGPFPACSGRVDETFTFTASGEVVGTGPAALLRITLDTSNPGPHAIVMSCTVPGAGTFPSRDEAGVSDEYGSLLGEFDLPANGGTRTVTSSQGGGVSTVRASATLTVVRSKS